MLSLIINLTKESLHIPEDTIVLSTGEYLVSKFDNESALLKADELYHNFEILASGYEKSETTVTMYIAPDAFHFGIYLALRRMWKKGFPRLVVIDGKEHIDLEDFTGKTNQWGETNYSNKYVEDFK